tara:strand:+ start:12 stop:512 length:501 start_codon:yes stop_codon:yes gene_type:complete
MATGSSLTWRTLPLKIITLNRIISSDEGILGLLHSNGKPIAVTLERPWKDNKAWESCIPFGIYPLTRLDKSKAFKYPHYLLEDVPDRTFIKIHVANYPSELHGCIGVGSYFANGAIAVCKSRNAMDHVMWFLDRHDEVCLNIREGYFTPFSSTSPYKLEPKTEEDK